MATVVRCERDGRWPWAMAIAADGPESALRAAIAAVNIFGRGVVLRHSRSYWLT